LSTPNAETTDPSGGSDYREWVGRVIDERYRVDGLLGEGGMGAVFVAEHLKLMKKVAIKVIHPEFAGDGDVAERFLREAMTAAQMEHPHVASATDYGTISGGGGYLVMQYVEGKSLRDVLDEEGALGWVRACDIAAQVADALAAAHAKGFVHRDLKPDNVMLQPKDDGGRLVKVLDFGIARVASDSVVGQGRRTLTRVGTVIGTPGYMAPEQALGEPVDYRADLYALGLLVHEMVTGEPVYDQSVLTAIVTRQLTETPPRLSTKVEGNLPQQLDDLVASMLEREKDKRLSSAADARDTFRALLLEATIQRVASGEHDLSSLSASALAGAADHGESPAPVPSIRRKAAQPPETNATVAGKVSARSAVPTPIRRLTSVATARTAIALEEVKKQVEKSKIPPPVLFGAIGCGALAVFAIVVVSLTAIFSGGEDGSDLPKLVHDRPIPEVTEPEERSILPTLGPPEVRVPDALLQAHADLLLADRTSERRAAARQVLAYQPAEEVPPYLIALASMENETRCEDKQPHLLRLRELGDVRVLPALERIDEERSGCRSGPFGSRRSDCYGCIREDITATLEALRAAM
jgi:serine/threonine protein kinase